MSQTIKTADVTPTSRSVAGNVGQSAVSFPAVHVSQSREDEASSQLQSQTGQAINKELPPPFQLKHNKAEIQTAAQLKKSNAVVQRVFNKASVEDAIMGANRGMKDMGGTTGGAFHLITNAQDPDVRELVLKASGRSSAVLASDIYNMIGIPAPKSLMLPVSEELINHLGTLTSGAREKFGSQASIEVQQHTNIVALPEDMSGYSSLERKSAVLAGDTLTGNHDRIHSENRENFSGAFAIDNVVKGNTIESRSMMTAAWEIIEKSTIVHKQIGKIYQSGRNTSSSQIEGLRIQKAFLSELQRIGETADDILMLIDTTNLQEDEHDGAILERLTKMEQSDTPVKGEPLEMVIGEISGDNLQKRKEIITINIGTKTKAIGTDRHPELRARLGLIRKWHEDGDISQALKMIDLRIDEISEDYKDRKGKWDSERSTAEDSAKKKWEDESFITKILSNREKYIQDILNGWEISNPKPQ